MELFLPKVDSAIDGQFYNIDNIVNENIERAREIAQQVKEKIRVISSN